MRGEGGTENIPFRRKPKFQLIFDNIQYGCANCLLVIVCLLVIGFGVFCPFFLSSAIPTYLILDPILGSKLSFQKLASYGIRAGRSSSCSSWQEEEEQYWCG